LTFLYSGGKNYTNPTTDVSLYGSSPKLKHYYRYNKFTTQISVTYVAVLVRSNETVTESE